MKRIAFISFGHMGSTFPLAKEFIKKEYEVDYIFTSSFLKNLEATDCCCTDSQSVGISEIEKTCYPKTCKYFESDRIHLYRIRTLRPYSSVPIINFFVKKIRNYQLIKICKFLNRKEYKMVNIVGRYNSDDILTFSKNLEARLLVSLHEVCNHFNPDFQYPTNVLDYLFKSKIDIIVHSENSYNEILKYKNADKEYIHCINFGLFKSFMMFNISNRFDLPDKYVLFIGHFRKYKGLNVLYDAVENNKSFFKGVKFVIAGEGNDSCLPCIGNNDHFILINKYLSNEDFVELIRRSMFVVCPYLTASQSGIPQVAFLYNKPVIASNLEGFKEIIFNGENGLLFSAQNSNELSICMKKLLEDVQLYVNMIDNIKNFELLHPSFSWDHIVEKYIELI